MKKRRVRAEHNHSLQLISHHFPRQVVSLFILRSLAAFLPLMFDILAARGAFSQNHHQTGWKVAGGVRISLNMLSNASAHGTAHHC